MGNRFLIHDLEKRDANDLAAGLPGDVCVFEAKPLVKYCVGCFGCWVKTPGRCVINDRLVATPALLSSCEELILISQMTYGGYSPEIKAVLDRSIGYVMPFFRIVNGEMHHTMRYPTPFKLTAYFYGNRITDSERKVARQLVEANALNLGAGNSSVFFYESIANLKGVFS